MECLKITLPKGLRFENAGLFVSPGQGMEEAGRAFEVRAGEALVLWPGRRHRGTAAYAADLSFYWVHFHPPGAGGAGARLRIPQHVRVARPERAAELFHRLLDQQEEDVRGGDEAALWVTLLLMELRRREPAAGEGAGRVLAGRAERFIAESFRRGIHAGDVARAVACNPDYLGRLYRRVYGCTVSEAIHRRQLQEARALLREGARNIEEVALACGFRESRYFRRLFAERQGASPRDYRKLHARAHVNTR